MDITLDQLKDQPPFQKVNVTTKILEIRDTTKLSDGWAVQDVVLGDQTSTAELALWQDFVDVVELGAEIVQIHKFDGEEF